MTVDFNDYFWGEKNNGFDVLYHNMKFGLAASRELAEFLRERSGVEEAHAKQLAKLAKQAAAGGMAGGGLVMGGRDAASGGPVAQSTFAPLWLLLRTSADRLSALHLHLVQRMTDLVKEVSRYAEDLHKKHKSVKEDESGTLEAVQAIQASTLHVQKVKDQLTQRTVEVEKLHKDNGSAKELEKAEAKLRKCQDDYRAAVDKYNTVKEDFERKMSQTCRHFQVLEESHLGQMKEFVGVYAKLVQHTHDQVGDVHADFRRQCQDLTVEKLLEQFVYAKHTGLEKPTLTELVNDHHQNTATLNQQQQLVSTESAATSAHAQQTQVDNANSTAATTKREGNDSFTNPLEVDTTTVTSPTTTATNAEIDATQSNNNAKQTSTSQRRTTSLLNLFMPNSAQGSRSVSLFRGASTSGVSGRNAGAGGGAAMPCSAPSSPIYPGDIARSTQRGSKWFLRSRRDKAKQKKSKKKKDGPDNISNKEDKSDMEEKDDSVKSTPPPSGICGTAPQAPSSLTSSTASRIDSLDAIAATTAVTNNAACASASGSPPPPLAASGSSGNIATAITSSSAVEAAGGGGGGMSHATSTNTNTGNSTADLVDEDGYTIQPVSPSHAWHTHVSSVGGTGTNTAGKTAGSFYSSSDSDSDDDRERKIRVEIKPLNNGAGPISASVDELRATVENLSLSPIGRRGSGLDGHGHHHHHHHHHDSHSNSSSIMKRSQSVSQQLGVGNAANAPSAIIPHAVAHLHGKSMAATDLLGLSLHSPAASNASTPTTASHPYTPLQSPSQPPTLNSPALSASSRYADLGDLFCEVGELSNTMSTTAGSTAPQTVSALSGQNLVSGTATTGRTRQIPTPTSGYMSIPRPPSRRSEAIAAAAAAAAASNANASTPVSRTLIASPAPTGSGAMARTDSVGSLEFRTAGVLVGVSRGPSPLTIGMMDTIPLAVAFHEIVHSYFRGSDEKRCQVKMSGEMMLSFPAGIVAILANNPNPAKLAIRIRNTQRLNAIMPNKELVSIDNTQSSADCLILEFNMTSLSALLKKQSEQNPSASYFNVDILKYQIKPKVGANSCPFQLVAYWKCDSTHTDLKVDYKYNSHAMNAPSPLLNVIVNVPIEGGVKNTQSKPTAQWLHDSNRIQWKFSELSQHSENGGIGSLLARVELDEPGSGAPTTISSQFNCEGTTLSGIDFQLVGPGYRLSLVKRRFISGKYICDGDLKYTTAPTSSGSGTATPSSTASTADRHL